MSKRQRNIFSLYQEKVGHSSPFHKKRHTLICIIRELSLHFRHGREGSFKKAVLPICRLSPSLIPNPSLPIVSRTKKSALSFQNARLHDSRITIPPIFSIHPRENDDYFIYATSSTSQSIPFGRDFTATQLLAGLEVKYFS